VLGHREPAVPPFGIAAAIVLLVLIAVRRSKYAVRIETNSGSSKLFWTTQERHIDEIIDLILAVMENQEREVNYAINMNDYSVKELVMGDKFKNIKHAAIATRKGGARYG
jgi:hypothetical protein